MTLPNFLMIGAAKSGTTALHEFIKQHPSIYLSPRKELRFFSNFPPPPKDLSEEYIHPGVNTLEEYIRYFDGVTDEAVIGESSPMYLYTPGTAERIKALLPEVKMLAILRNPTQRAYSAYTHALREWREPASSFEEALGLEQERIDAGWGMLWHYTQSGFYYQQLMRYYRVFKPDQLKVVLYDDLVSNAPGLLQDIFNFLGVDPSFKPDTTARVNVSGFPMNQKYHQFLYQLFMRSNPIKKISRLIIPKSIRQQTMIKMRAINLEKRVMPEEIRDKLNQLFYNDIKQLEGLLQRDLSFWVK